MHHQYDMTHIFTMTCYYLSHTVQFNKVLFDMWLYDALKVRRMIVAPIYVLKISEVLFGQLKACTNEYRKHPIIKKMRKIFTNANVQ